MLNAPDIEKTCPMCNVDITMDDIEFLGEKGVPGLKKVFVKEEGKKKWVSALIDNLIKIIEKTDRIDNKIIKKGNKKGNK